MCPVLLQSALHDQNISAAKGEPQQIPILFPDWPAPQQEVAGCTKTHRACTSIWLKSDQMAGLGACCLLQG